MSIDTLRSVIRDLLPSGPFWESAAVERFVHALAAAVEPLDTFIEGLPAAIHPRTAARPVLLDWWEFIRGECSGTPTDTEELRDRVIETLAAPPVHTFSGLQAIVVANGLSSVELRELPFISGVPFDVPSEINAHARILDVWNSSLLHDPAVVMCVVRQFAQAADVLRYLSPSSFIRNKGDTAGARAFAWLHAWGTASLSIDRLPGDGTGASSTVFALPTEDGAATWADALGILEADSVAGDLVRWTLRRDFGSGPVAVESEQDNLDSQAAAFEALTGLVPSHVWPGWFSSTEAEDTVAGCLFTANGGTESIESIAGAGLDPAANLTIGRFVTVAGTDGFTMGPCDFGEMSESTLIVMAYRVNTAPVSPVCVVGNRQTSGDELGWAVQITAAGALVFAVDYVDQGANDLEAVVFLASSTDPGWHVAVFLVDRAALTLQGWTESLSADPDTFPGPFDAISTEPLTIGAGRLPGFDGEIGLLVECRGAQVEGADGAAIAAAIHAALVL